MDDQRHALSRRTLITRAAAGAGATALGTVHGAGPAAAEPLPDSGPLRVGRTTVEYAERLLGTDVAAPRLSWALAADGHGARQSAYQVRVASSPERLDDPDVWDSGRVESARSVGVGYGGPPLAPRTRYHWRVRAWDAAGRPSPWSEASWWETALLSTPWTARWIGNAPVDDDLPDFGGTSWIWSPGSTTSDAPVGPRWFRAALELPAGEVTRARLVMTADDDFTLFLDGEQVLHEPETVDGWRTAQLADVTERVRAAGPRVVLAAVATNRPGATLNPAGLLGTLVVELAGGDVAELVTGPGWRSSDTERPGWTEPGHDDSGWPAAAVLAPYGSGPWGSGVSLALPERAAPLLRRAFTLDAPVTRARLYVSGLAYHEVRLNGRRVGDAVLDPGFTDYDDTVLYATHDVTDLLAEGANAAAVELGRGFYGMTTPNVWNWHVPPWHGEPRLLFQLEVDHPDGSRTVVASDEQWRIADGPTLVNSQYTGETYDARLAVPGWTDPGFDDSGWAAASELDGPAGRLTAQEHEPIRITETVAPVSVTGIGGGRYVADFGRTTAGWVRISVAVPAGTTVSVLHGEKLRDDGTVDAVTGHVPGGRFQRDEYVAAGTGRETWEPRFTYKGFRYVQIEGLPAAPSVDDLRCRVLHNDVATTGTFACSEPMYGRIDDAMRRTVLNNLHGIPTDTPMFEKNGWTGDAQVGAPSMAFAFDLARFLTKWTADLSASRAESGQLPVIVPSSGWGYRELAPSPEWTTVFPYLVRELYRWYGDVRLVETHYDAVADYVDWEVARRVDGLAPTALGDWVAPGYQGTPPEDPRLTATSYLHRALHATADLADLLGRDGDADRYRAIAAESRDALNATFLDTAAGHYRTDRDPGYRQTSNAIPLAFGLVPAEAEESVVASLVADIAQRGNHLNTGCLGTSVLLPTLCRYGHADVAHALATQTTYPSWGYWLANGADTMWEMWELNSRSRDHYFLGTVSQWFYENVAGLRPGDNGYQSFVVRPDGRAGLRWARASLRTVRGEAAVAWASTGRVFHLDVDVPVGATAEVHVPAARPGEVGVAPAAGAGLVRTEPGWAVFAAGHGRWRFTSRL